MWAKFKAAAGRVVPAYAYIPAAAILFFNLFVYYATRPITAEAKHYDLSIFIDGLVPFVPFFILFYVLAYAQWGGSYLLHSHIGKETFYHIATADIIAKLICFAFFIAMPTEIARPEASGGGIWNGLTNGIFSIDPPNNLFPSIHCLESWVAFRGALLMKKAPRFYAPAQLVLTLLVFASTVFLKQHFFVDIIGGVLVVEIGWLLSRRLRLWRIWEKLELPCVRKNKSHPEKSGSEG